jgi:hypothetical protein
MKSLFAFLAAFLTLGIGDISTAGGGGSGGTGAAFQVPQEISTASLESVGVKGFNLLAAYASGTWQSASRAIFIPFVLNGSFACKNIWVANGAPVSGNWDLGIYTSAGVKVASTGLTAQAGTNTTQTIALVTALSAGNYYMAAVLDNVVGACYGVAPVASLASSSLAGMAEQAAASPLPANATFASAQTMTKGILMGITQRTFV